MVRPSFFNSSSSSLLTLFSDPMGGFELPLTEFLQVSSDAQESLQTVVKEVSAQTLKPLKHEKVSGTLSFKLEFRYF